MFDNVQGTVATLIPTKLQSFYSDEVRNEPVLDEEGNPTYVSESFTYTDENGDSQTGSRLVAAYSDVDYIVKNPANDLKSLDDIKRSIQAGAPSSHITYTINKAIESAGWEYHDAYLEYLANEPQADDEKYLETIPDTEPEEYVYDYATDHASWVALEPDAWTGSVSGLDDVKLDYAKKLRDQLIESNIVVHGVEWQVDVIKDEPRIQRAINVAEYSSSDPSTTVNWVLADNTIRASTAQDLKDVLSAKAFREEQIFASYVAWRESGMIGIWEYN